MAALARLLRFASIVICLIVAASFLTFVIQQTKGASSGQQEALSAGTPTSSAPTSPSKPKKGAVHKALDEASDAFTSPFSGIVSSSSSEWAIRSVKLILSLLVYGFALGYVARMLRVRV
ncbi:MAG TPA: hypothetical protein VII01_09510 [Solirubrobacteraceae bacterium]